MAVPVCEGEKMVSKAHVCVIEYSLTAVRCSLGRLNMARPSLDVFESSSIQSSGKRIDTFSIFYDKIGEGLTCSKCLCEAVTSASMVQSLHWPQKLQVGRF